MRKLLLITLSLLLLGSIASHANLNETNEKTNVDPVILDIQQAARSYIHKNELDVFPEGNATVTIKDCDTVQLEGDSSIVYCRVLMHLVTYTGDNSATLIPSGTQEYVYSKSTGGVELLAPVE